MSERTLDTVSARFQGAATGSEGVESQRLLATLRRRLAGVEQPARIGRYAIVSMLGSGAMGVVYLGYDKELDRQVAVKVILGRGGDADLEERLRREARALARVSHENVVQVFEVGMTERGPFIAMEYIEGQPLNRWLTAKRRRWPDIVRMYIEVGRGLAVVHAAGLLHRDFKPSNVLVGNDDRPRLADFGLARLGLDDAGADFAEPHSLDARTADVSMTQGPVGTPAYMSIEQATGGVVDHRADQFSFCAALYEALYGRRPFASDRVLARLAELGRDQIRQPPAGSRVPTAVFSVLQRGLRRDADRRFASMEDVLQSLRKALRRRSWSRFVVIGAAGGMGLWGLATEPSPGSCEDAATRVDQVWGVRSRRELTEAIASSGLAYADDTERRVATGLDAYAVDWTRAYADACLDVGTEQFDQRMSCLDRRLQEFSMAVDVLRQADDAAVRYAVKTVAGITPVSNCQEAAHLESRVPLPLEATTRARVRTSRADLAEAAALRRLAKWEEATALVDEVLQSPQVHEYPPLLAEALLERGAVESAHGNVATGHDWLQRAYEAAIAARADEVAGRAAAQLVTVSLRLALIPEAERWAALARAYGPSAVEAQHLLYLEADVMAARGQHAGAADLHRRALEACPESNAQASAHVGAHHARLADSLGASGRHAEALSERELALSTTREALGPTHPETAKDMLNLATEYGRYARFEDAVATFEEATDLLEQALGPDHPDVGAARVGYAGALQRLGQVDESLEQAQRGERILRAAYGSEHPWAINAVLARANAHAQSGRLADAVSESRRALALLERTLTPDPKLHALALENLGYYLERQGQSAEAIESFERAVQQLTTLLGPGHPRTLNAREGLAGSLNGSGEHSLALAEFRAAEAAGTAELGADHPAVGRALIGVAISLDYLGRPVEGIGPLERARSIFESGQDPRSLGRAEENLAIALWGRVAERPRARALAMHAQELFRDAEDPTGARRVAQWLESRDD